MNLLKLIFPQKTKGCLHGKTPKQKIDFFKSLRKFEEIDEQFFKEQHADLLPHERSEFLDWVLKESRSKKQPQLLNIEYQELKSDFFQLVFDFKFRDFEKVHLCTDNSLAYFDENNQLSIIEFDKSLYGTKNPKDYLHFQSRNKNQVVFLFVPFSFFAE